MRSQKAVEQVGCFDASDRSMLLVLPLPFHRGTDGSLRVERQGLNGLRCWLEHFSPLTLAAPVRPNRLADQIKNSVWDLPPASYFEKGLVLHPLPWGYHPLDHFRKRQQVAGELAVLIQKHRYLQMGIGGCTFGDWAAIGARLARRAGRPYAIHTDWVTHRVFKIASARQSLRRRVQASIHALAMRRAERKIIRASSLGLFHGADTYEGYKAWCPRPEMIHDAQVQPSELRPEPDVAQKIQQLKADRPLRIVYAGRAIEMKGPDQWIDALAQAKAQGVRFVAKWFGTGELIPSMRQQIQQRNLQEEIQLPGQLNDRNALLQEVFEADLLLFCHLTPESPRILIEAMSQATPIVGYGSNYSAELTESGGGLLVPVNQPKALAQAVVQLDADRPHLQKLMRQARQASEALTDQVVFSHRADLIKSCLP